MRNFIP